MKTSRVSSKILGLFDMGVASFSHITLSFFQYYTSLNGSTSKDDSIELAW